LVQLRAQSERRDRWSFYKEGLWSARTGGRGTFAVWLSL